MTILLEDLPTGNLSTRPSVVVKLPCWMSHEDVLIGMQEVARRLHRTQACHSGKAHIAQIGSGKIHPVFRCYTSTRYSYMVTDHVDEPLEDKKQYATLAFISLATACESPNRLAAEESEIFRALLEAATLFIESIPEEVRRRRVTQHEHVA